MGTYGVLQLGCQTLVWIEYWGWSGGRVEEEAMGWREREEGDWRRRRMRWGTRGLHEPCLCDSGSGPFCVGWCKAFLNSPYPTFEYPI